MNYIFIGPSSYGIDRKLFNGWIVKAPCQQSDIIDLISNETVENIVIVDGYYKSIPAPWHKEFLLALENGIHIVGLGSIGALRANELREFGVEGYGWVYNFIKDNEPIDDSIVALLHKSSEENYQPITFAKVELIFILSQLMQSGKLSICKFEELKEIILYEHFERLNYIKALKLFKKYQIEDPEKLLKSSFHSIKRLDVENYLKQYIFTKKPTKLQNDLVVERTPYIYRQLCTDLPTKINSNDISDLNITLQSYAFYHHNELYEKYNLIAQSRLLVKMISCKYMNDSKNDIHSYIHKYHLDNIVRDSINIEQYKIDTSYEDFIMYIVKSDKYIWINALDISEINMIINIYLHPKLTNSIGIVEESHVSNNKFLLIALLKLCLIYNNSSNENMNVLDYSEQNNNKRYSAVIEVFELMYRYIKSNAINFYHGAIIIQSLLKENYNLLSDYKKHINYKNDNKPFKIYLDYIKESRRLKTLKEIKSINMSQIIPLKPKTCIGSHFIQFDYLLGYLESIKE